MNPAYIGRGTLQVVVTVGDDPSPIQGARVRVTDPADGAVLAELTTDSSGQTETIELPTPPIEDSIAESDVRPYATYNVTATAEGFETLHISGVQLLPDSLSVQRSSMGPAKAGFNVRNVMLEPHTLWGDFPPKIPEDEVKPLPDAGGLVVLPKPVVPEFIVVHMGVPSDSSAPNHWIFFRDYIKNVACSEIYSTWPESTIVANVLAILSFTMNRVYTEFYRNQGYDFTITSSTAFDHKWIYGRNIFQSISLVVDEIFDNYLSRPEVRQPILTQYCDGKRVSCPNWMTQWGSCSLGEQGYSAIQILRYFYGDSIYINTAEQIEGIPASWPGYELTIGSSGQKVQQVQEQLDAIATVYSYIPRVNPDGIFGPATQRAVMAFQSVFGLPETGVIDFRTWYKISHIFVSVTRMAELA